MNNTDQIIKNKMRSIIHDGDTLKAHTSDLPDKNKELTQTSNFKNAEF